MSHFGFIHPVLIGIVQTGDLLVFEFISDVGADDQILAHNTPGGKIRFPSVYLVRMKPLKGTGSA
jgi:hypothetical protein